MHLRIVVSISLSMSWGIVEIDMCMQVAAAGAYILHPASMGAFCLQKATIAIATVPDAGKSDVLLAYRINLETGSTSASLATKEYVAFCLYHMAVPISCKMSMPSLRSHPC